MSSKSEVCESEFKHPIFQNYSCSHYKFPWIFSLGSLAQSNTTTTLATNPTTTLTNTTLPPTNTTLPPTNTTLRPTNTTLPPTTTAEPCYDSFPLEMCQEIMAAGICTNISISSVSIKIFLLIKWIFPSKSDWSFELG